MAKEEKAKYGFVAWKFFAYMGLIGFIGLAVFLLTPKFPQSLRLITSLSGGIVAFIGLYIGASYLYLYPTTFRVEQENSHIGRTIDIKGDERILDVGCGTGRVSIQFAKSLTTGKLIGIDIFEGVIGWSSPKVSSGGPLRMLPIEMPRSRGWPTGLSSGMATPWTCPSRRIRLTS